MLYWNIYMINIFPKLYIKICIVTDKRIYHFNKQKLHYGIIPLDVALDTWRRLFLYTDNICPLRKDSGDMSGAL